jgi:hypothetical protein
MAYLFYSLAYFAHNYFIDPIAATESNKAFLFNPYTVTIEHPTPFDIICDLPEVKPVYGIGYGQLAADSHYTGNRVTRVTR